MAALMGPDRKKFITVINLKCVQVINGNIITNNVRTCSLYATSYEN